MALEIRQLGLVGYQSGLAIQHQVAEEIRDHRLKGILLVLRHPRTITLGRRTDPGEIHATDAHLRKLDIGLHHVDRGGGATYHHPGQSIVYPIVSLSRLRIDVQGLIRLLGRSVLDILEEQEITAQWDPKRPGVYVRGSKIASVGLHLSRDVITHGLALNVGPENDGFALIDPCKEAGLKVTSMADLLGVSPDPDEIGDALARRLREYLEP